MGVPKTTLWSNGLIGGCPGLSMESRSWLRPVTAKEKGRGRECAAEARLELPRVPAREPRGTPFLSCSNEL